MQSVFALFAFNSTSDSLKSLAVPNSKPPLQVCDIHIHLLGVSRDNGCYVSPRFQKSLIYNLRKILFDSNSDDDPNYQDRMYVHKLDELLSSSKEHKFGILLSLDGVYDNQGNLDLNNTGVYVPNDYLFNVCAKNKKFIPGASVNPYRKDALDELERVSDLGAVLIKWIPNSQNIDPSDPSLLPFYRKLIDLNLPLLSHGGSEDALPTNNQSFGNPLLYQLPLEEGVKVIIAHLAVGSRIIKGTYFYKLLTMFDKYSNLYGEPSSLTMLQKTYWVKYLLDHPDLFDRLYYGSDFPLQFFPATSPLYFLGRLSFREAWEIQVIDNVLVRDVETWKALAVPNAFFERGIELVERKNVSD